MGERKVLNKHIPPDIDPLKIRKMRGRPNNQQKKIRNMLAMSIRCNTCGNYMSRGTKFNSRKEDAVGEKHLGTIQIYRFYIKCKHCSSEITFKTDPGNSDYAVETGATRNFEPWRAKDEEADKQKRKRETEEMGDAMKSLENRTRDSKRELDILAALDEIESLKSRHAMVSVDAMLEALQRRAAAEKGKKAEFEEDEAVIKAIFQSREVIVRRISDDELIDDDLESRANLKTRSVSQDNASNKPTDSLAEASAADGGKVNAKVCYRPMVRISVIKKSAGNELPATSGEKEKREEGIALQSLCQYGSDDDQ